PIRFSFASRPLHDTTFFIEYRPGVILDLRIEAKQNLDPDVLVELAESAEIYGISAELATAIRDVIEPQLRAFTEIAANSISVQINTTVPTFGFSVGFRKRLFKSTFVGANLSVDSAILAGNNLDSSLEGEFIPAVGILFPNINMATFVAISF
nr:hypothetical protein [Alphaproteobacteria bacterium]